MQKRRQYLNLAILFLIALAARLLFLKYFNKAYIISPDGLNYSNMAENFLQGLGIKNTIGNRDYVVGPIYPLFLAFVYSLAGLKNYAAVVIFQAIVSAITVVLGYKIGEELFGKFHGYITYLLFLGYPMFSFWMIYVLTETMYIFMITLFLYVLVLYSKNIVNDKQSFKYAILVGAVIGLANLVRPMLLLVFPVLLVWLLILHGYRPKVILRNIILMGIATALVMSPWWIRNYLKYNQFIVATNYGAYELYAGNNPYTVTNNFFAMELKSYDPAVKERISKLPVQEQEKEYSKEAKNYILSHPIMFLQRTYDKGINLFWEPITEWYANAYGFIAYEFDEYYLNLGLIGALLSVIWFRRMGIFLFLALYYSFIVSMITVVSGGRYRVPIMPAVIILGSLVFLAIVELVKKLLNKKRVGFR